METYVETYGSFWVGQMIVPVLAHSALTSFSGSSNSALVEDLALRALHGGVEPEIGGNSETFFFFGIAAYTNMQTLQHKCRIY